MKRKSRKKQRHSVGLGKKGMDEGKAYGHKMIGHNVPHKSESAMRADMHSGMSKHNIHC